LRRRGRGFLFPRATTTHIPTAVEFGKSRCLTEEGTRHTHIVVHYEPLTSRTRTHIRPLHTKHSTLQFLQLVSGFSETLLSSSLGKNVDEIGMFLDESTARHLDNG
jgi:hypothetical protein